jgi:hypothetical protein
MTMRSVLGWTTFVLALVAGQAAASELSLGCIYMALTETHELILFCGDQIDSQSEANYAALRADLGKFINENAREDRHKIGGKQEREARERLESDNNRHHYCGDTYPTVKKIFYDLVRVESMDAIRKRLESPSDPAEGDCL